MFRSPVSTDEKMRDPGNEVGAKPETSGFYVNTVEPEKRSPSGIGNWPLNTSSITIQSKRLKCSAQN